MHAERVTRSILTLKRYRGVVLRRLVWILRARRNSIGERWWAGLGSLGTGARSAERWQEADQAGSWVAELEWE